MALDSNNKSFKELMDKAIEESIPTPEEFWGIIGSSPQFLGTAPQDRELLAELLGTKELRYKFEISSTGGLTITDRGPRS
jgi:hypothetical protein